MQRALSRDVHGMCNLQSAATAHRNIRVAVGVLALMIALVLGACGKSPVVVTYPPHDSPFKPYTDIVWLGASEEIGTVHTPLLSTSYNPRNGEVAYTTQESRSGWWSISTATDSIRRTMAPRVYYPALRGDGAALAFTHDYMGGRFLCTAPLSGGELDFGGLEVIGPGSGALHWTTHPDSLLLNEHSSKRLFLLARASGAGRRL